MMVLKNVGVAGIVLSVLMLCSCGGNLINSDDYEFEKIEAMPTMALPLAYGDLAITDILSKEDSINIKVYPDGLVYLDYEQILKSQAIRDLITVPDKNNVDGTLAVPAGNLPPVPGDIPAVTPPHQRVVFLTLHQKNLLKSSFRMVISTLR